MRELLTRDRVIALVFIACGAVFLSVALTFSPGYLDDSMVMGPMSYPKWLLIGWVSVSGIYFVTGKKQKSPVDLSKSAPSLLASLAVIAAYFFLFPVLGLPVSTFLFLVAFCFLGGMRNLKIVLSVAGLTALLFWFVFEEILKISMPRGILDLFG
jgi:hypothetical protein